MERVQMRDESSMFFRIKVENVPTTIIYIMQNATPSKAPKCVIYKRYTRYTTIETAVSTPQSIEMS